MQSMQRLIGSVSIFLFSLILIAPTVVAQEENENSFEQLMAEWTALDQQLKADEGFFETG